MCQFCALGLKQIEIDNSRFNLCHYDAFRGQTPFHYPVVKIIILDR